MHFLKPSQILGSIAGNICERFSNFKAIANSSLHGAGSGRTLCGSHLALSVSSRGGGASLDLDEELSSTDASHKLNHGMKVGYTCTHVYALYIVMLHRVIIITGLNKLYESMF